MVYADERTRHWDDAYKTRGPTAVSWFQSNPHVSLELIERMEIGRQTPVIDIGGGESMLVDHLLASGFEDLSVLDLSAVALSECRRRVGDGRVRFLQSDVLAWRPDRQYELWHDRALFHFLVDQEDRDNYLAALQAGLRPRGVVIIGTFAEDGPESCSGLPVARYSSKDLVTALGEDFEIVETRRQRHITPVGTMQPFTWVAATRNQRRPKRSTRGGC